MADFPFKNATFTDYTCMKYPILEYGKKYYAKLSGKIMAVKPVAFGIFGNPEREDRGWTHRLKVLAADGKEYDLCDSTSLYATPEDLITKEKDPYAETYIKPENKLVRTLILQLGGTIRGSFLFNFAWDKESGVAIRKQSGYIFWADKDGEHIKFECNEPGINRYMSIEKCVDDNIEVMEFDDNAKKPESTYTVVREFKVNGVDSQEEAERVIDKKLSGRRKNG